MATRLPSRRVPPIGFAHRGALSAEEGLLTAFSLALQLGATGLESDVWITADGHAVLDHDGTVSGRLRRRPISQVDADDLPPHVPRLSDVYRTCGTGFELSLDVRDPAAVAEAVAVARDVGAESRLWLCHRDRELLATWRELSPDTHLVDSTRLRSLRRGPERHAADLAAAGIDAIKLHQSDWSGGLVALFHRFELDALGWDAHFARTIGALLDAGIDGVYSDHVEVLMGSIRAVAE